MGDIGRRADPSLLVSHVTLGASNREAGGHAGDAQQSLPLVAVDFRILGGDQKSDDRTQERWFSSDADTPPVAARITARIGKGAAASRSWR
jgi:hypothetical protein